MSQPRDYQEKYQSLRDSYMAKLPMQLDMIDDGWSKLNNIQWDPNQLKKLQRIVHSIAGTAGSFGLEDLSHNAEQLETILNDFSKSSSIPDNATKIKVYAFIQSMFDCIGMSSNLPTVEDLNASQALQVLIVDSNEEQASYLELLCFELGCSTKVANSLEDVKQHVHRAVPDVILIDIAFPHEQPSGAETVKEIYRKIGFKVPVVFISSRNDMLSKVSAFRAGGLGYLHKPVDISELKVQFELLKNHKHYHAKILVIDDDQDFVQLMSSMLDSQGFYCVSSHQASEVMKLIEHHRPDILILDTSLPNVQSRIILQTLRDDVKLAGLPVLLLSSGTNPDIIKLANAQGANGIIPKPLEFNVLLDSIHTVLKSSKSIDAVLERITKKDTGNQTVQRHYFYTRIEKAIGLNAQTNSQLLVSISFKNHENIRRQIGFHQIEKLTEHITDAIQQDLSDNEFITLVSELHFALILSNTSQASIDNRLQKLIARINNLTPKHNNFIISLNACLSAIHLNANYQSVDEALHAAEAPLLELVKSPDDIIAIEKGKSLQPLNESDLLQIVANAISQKSLYLNYQPVFDISGREKLFEGLARMRDGNQAILLPDDFIGNIQALRKQDEFNQLIIQTCIADLKKFQVESSKSTEIIIKLILDAPLAPEFFSWLQTQLYTGASKELHNRVVFAITEEDIYTLPEKIATLKNGIKLLDCDVMVEKIGRSAQQSLDHFDEIVKLNARYFKLHPNMTRAILKQEEDALDLLAALQKLGIPIIASHVEDNSMFSRLWESGIRYFQGYFVKRPEQTLEFDFSFEDTELT
ncbi:CAI-1 autoinducer sensor kinase/phosphatase CqsS [Thalassocella blandensis]|nr:CAI-1 autoinducer sensor kinase/phosphatase CqsS [Thalassocella blandensis]